MKFCMKCFIYFFHWAQMGDLYRVCVYIYTAIRTICKLGMGQGRPLTNVVYVQGLSPYLLIIVFEVWHASCPLAEILVMFWICCFSSGRICPFTGKKWNKANKVSHSNHKTKRLQFVNLQYKRIWWEAGKRYVKLRLSTKALKTIEKNGLDAVAKKAGIDLSKEWCISFLSSWYMRFDSCFVTFFLLLWMRSVDIYFCTSSLPMNMNGLEISLDIPWLPKK